MADSALSGLKVVELGDFIAAPYCAKLMADMGAEVIKIEPPGLGDSARRYGPFPNDEPHLGAEPPLRIHEHQQAGHYP